MMKATDPEPADRITVNGDAINFYNMTIESFEEIRGDDPEAINKASNIMVLISARQRSLNFRICEQDYQKKDTRISSVYVSFVPFEKTRTTNNVIQYKLYTDYLIVKKLTPEGLSITLRLVCLDDKPLAVFITLNPPGQRFIEFSFIKMCRKPRKIIAKVFLTAGRIFAFMAFGFVLFVRSISNELKRRKGKKPKLTNTTTAHVNDDSSFGTY